jgi:hypothetical protein
MPEEMRRALASAGVLNSFERSKRATGDGQPLLDQ